MKTKYFYFVAIISEDNSLKFVTRVDNTTRTCLWSDNCQAKVFTKTIADDLMFGLRCNGYNAVVIKCDDFQIFKNN